MGRLQKSIQETKIMVPRAFFLHLRLSLNRSTHIDKRKGREQQQFPSH
jgi:hypothetical protein